jgi:hypothetical protein
MLGTIRSRTFCLLVCCQKNLKIRIHRTNFACGSVLYEIWSLLLREEHRPKVFENRAQREILGPKRDELNGGWRKLRKEELRYLYTSSSIVKIIKSRRIRWLVM